MNYEGMFGVYLKALTLNMLLVAASGTFHTRLLFFPTVLFLSLMCSSTLNKGLRMRKKKKEESGECSY